MTDANIDTHSNWTDFIGCSPREFCRRLYHRRPEWVAGMISLRDAYFLFERVLAARPTTAVEIGTASGVSTAFLCEGLRIVHKAGQGASRFQVFTYDISRRFYADRTKRVGDAAREMLDADLLEHIEIRAPAVASELTADHARGSINFLFIDAAHRHPWPVLDLLAALDVLAVGAEVVLHDINLPAVGGSDAPAGAQYVFEGLQVAKRVPTDPGHLANIGSLTIPSDKRDLRRQLVRLAADHPWEVDVPPQVVRSILGDTLPRS